MSKKSTFGKKPPEKERTIDEIKAEYSTVCGMAGEEQFKMKGSEARLLQLNQRLVQLHTEYNAAEAKQKTAAAPAASPAEATPLEATP